MDTVTTTQNSIVIQTQEHRTPAQESPLKAGSINDISQRRPWIRYFARLLDILLAGAFFSILFGLIAPQALNLNELSYGLLILFLWIFLESILLASWGTTPGKWIFNIHLKNSENRKLNLQEALLRSFKIWVYGLGAGIPLLSLITMSHARSSLLKYGETSWDKDGKVTVVHRKFGLFNMKKTLTFFKWVFAVSAICVIIFNTIRLHTLDSYLSNRVLELDIDLNNKGHTLEKRVDVLWDQALNNTINKQTTLTKSDLALYQVELDIRKESYISDLSGKVDKEILNKMTIPELDALYKKTYSTTSPSSN